ncbi:MAG: winged helix-turn-helix domain-containing protein [Candidatus Aenigmarchaeota archaeon]|nr:winged helix-turn-helix domain-containing protein [Candidatus Aenigmarchaeota archaeon]
MLELIRRQKEEETKPIVEVTPRDVLFVGSAIEILREMKEKVDRIDFRLRELERKFDERISERVLSESKFVQDTAGSEDIVNKIIAEVKRVSRPLIPHKEKITIVESKRIERIISFLQDHRTLTSSQLANMMGLSRTRCNEYFKQMEELGIVKGNEMGKEIFYRLVE